MAERGFRDEAMSVVVVVVQEGEYLASLASMPSE